MWWNSVNDGNTPSVCETISVIAMPEGPDLERRLRNSTVFKSVPGWTDDGDENFDYGAIILPVPLGATVGVFGIAIIPDAELVQSVAQVSGYPGDKSSGTQWYGTRQIAAVNARKVFYDIDTAGGQSGAPVFRTEADGKRIGVAVHAYGGVDTNSGTRINSEVLAAAQSWLE